MNKLTLDIIKRFDVNVGHALEIQEILYSFGLDLSEISNRELNRNLDAAYTLWKKRKGGML
jgi:hypothetical protein